MTLPPNARFETICLHAGQRPDPTTGAIITPIYQTSTYVQDSLGQHKGYEYARTQNPTRASLEANLAAIEGGPGLKERGRTLLGRVMPPEARRKPQNSAAHLRRTPF